MAVSLYKQQQRLLAIDECLSGGKRKWTMAALMERCNEKLAELRPQGYSSRTYYDDINVLKDFYQAPIEREQGKVWYTDGGFSIRELPMSAMDVENYEDMIQPLMKFCNASKDVDTNGLREFIVKWLGDQDTDGEAVGFDNVSNYEGSSWYDQAFNAIVNRQTLRLLYRPFGKAEAKAHVVFPQYLKQYNGRWFLMATKAGEPDNPQNIALDRIEEMEEYDKVGYEKSDINFDEFFSEMIGVTRPQGKSAERVVLRVKKGEYPYMETKPLHWTQEKVGEDDEWVTVELKVVVNYELKQKLFAYADNVVVVKPQSLRDSLKSMVNNMMENYAD